ncbi:MAG: hypothetical protein ABSB10_03170 [Candidatus Bathyarchaeia archaeon]|jgi:hypothetical protein
MNKRKLWRTVSRGWFPKEPTPLRKYTPNPPEDQKPKQPSQQSRSLRGIVFGLLFALIGIMNLFTRQYVIASLYLGLGITSAVLGYVAQRWQIRIRPRIGLAVFLIGLGVITFFYSDIATLIFESVAMIASLISFGLGPAFGLWILVALLVGLTYIYLAITKQDAHINTKKNLSKRYLSPYGAAAIFLFLTDIAVISSVEFDYAIPIAFIIAGILVLMGLGRFAVTKPALIVLLISILLLGSAVAGMYTVTYISENRYLTKSQALNVDTVNLTVNSMEGDIRIYFTNDSTQICHIAFVKEYGPIISDRGAQYNTKSNYDTEPASFFNYTIENGKANITARSYTTLVNITVNQNLKYDLNFFTYFGEIRVYVPPGVNSVHSTNLASRWGDVKIVR